MSIQNKDQCGTGRCDCPVHDFVAKLLNIRSTRVDGYDPNKSIKPLTAAEAVKYLVPKANPPRPRKPKFDPKVAEVAVVKGLEQERDMKWATQNPSLASKWQDPSGGYFQFVTDIDKPVHLIYRRGNHAIKRNIMDLEPETVRRAMKITIAEMDEYDDPGPALDKPPFLYQEQSENTEFVAYKKRLREAMETYQYAIGTRREQK